ncbi:hypothetical protein ACFFRK_19025 [Amorphoplanes digitatis]
MKLRTDSTDTGLPHERASLLADLTSGLASVAHSADAAPDAPTITTGTVALKTRMLRDFPSQPWDRVLHKGDLGMVKENLSLVQASMTALMEPSARGAYESILSRSTPKVIQHRAEAQKRQSFIHSRRHCRRLPELL